MKKCHYCKRVYPSTTTLKTLWTGWDVSWAYDGSLRLGMGEDKYICDPCDTKQKKKKTEKKNEVL